MLDGNVEKSSYPVTYHVTPVKGLLNDPNGLVVFKGEYHVFYQWNPTGTTHENKVWGHVVSDDMVHWQRLPAALVPSEDYDKDGIYSGSAVVHEETMYVFYTGNVIEKDGTRKSYQCLALSEDGRHFVKQGPIFPHPAGYSRHVRDPKVWFDDEQSKWYLLLGAQTDDGKGTALLYSSRTLRDWQLLGEFFSEEELKKLSQRGFMWECPDFFYIGEAAFFLYSPQGIEEEDGCYQNIYQSVYLKVEPLAAGAVIADSLMYELDWGFEFYAPQTFLTTDGRRMLYGWMGVMPPAKEQAVPTVKEGWLHHLSIPRQLDTRDGLLIQQPAAELKQLRAAHKQVDLSDSWRYCPSISTVELVFCFDSEAEDMTVRLQGETAITYSRDSRQLSLSRRDWLAQRTEYRNTTLDRPLTELRVFLDGSSLELFANHGESVASARFFEDGELEIVYEGCNKGNAVIHELKL